MPRCLEKKRFACRLGDMKSSYSIDNPILRRHDFMFYCNSMQMSINIWPGQPGGRRVVTCRFYCSREER